MQAHLLSIPFFTHGVESSVLNATGNSGLIITTLDDVPWNAMGMIVASIVTAPAHCFIVDKFGRKIGFYVITILQGATCVPTFLSPTIPITIIQHVLSGSSSSGIFIVLPIYIRELSDDVIRGETLSLMMVMTSLGYMMKLVMGLDELMYLLVTLMMIQFLVMFVLIETPSFLVKIGKIEKAKSNLAKLISLEDNNPTVLSKTTDLKNESDRARSKGKLSLICILRNVLWRDATKIGLILHITLILCGSTIFLDQNKALAQLGTDADPKGVLVLASMFIGSSVCALLIRFFERKYILTFGYGIMVLSMGVLAIYTQTDVMTNVKSFRWVPVTMLAVLVFGYGVTWGLPTIILVEMFNFEIRATLIGAIYVISQIIRLAHVHSFPYIEDYIGIYTMLYIFVGVNIFGGVYALFRLPNVKEKNVREIEKQLKRIPLIKIMI